MGSGLNGVPRTSPQRVNQFALVIYINDPLAKFLDDLRLELVKGCRPRAHMTVLPPRPLPAVEPALAQAEQQLAAFAPFEIEIHDIEVFPRTNVIYLGVSHGDATLREIHAAMNTGALAYNEPFDYHPHITLAQDFDAAELPRLEALARECWHNWRGPRTFPAERVAFVQNTESNNWVDLAEFSLGTAVPHRA